MDTLDKLNLNKMINANNVQDCTDEIRQKKHSQLIRDDVTRLLSLKQKYSRLAKSNPSQFDSMCVSQCSFIFNNYMDIFNKVKKDEMNLQILNQLLDVLKQIEDGVLDQHMGAFEVGKLLKSMYIDSALLKAEKIDKKTGKKTTIAKPKEKKITWAEFKAQQQAQEQPQ
jgi:hypothetical protein